MLAGYSQFCAYLERVSGIVLGEDKKYLVESRVLPIVKREKLTGLPQLVGVLQSGRAPKLVDEIIDVMTINETYFFRDKSPFELIADKILPRLHAVRPAGLPLRIWSAACSSGQEPYTLSIIAEERQASLKGRVVEIVATDVSETVLKKAREGVYSSFEAERGLTPDRLKRYFVPAQNGWKVNDGLKRRVSFRALNLLSDYAALGTFDLILCRNVLIYFNSAQKNDVINRLARCLRPNGLLMLGAAESALGGTSQIVSDPEFKGCYRAREGLPKESAHRPGAAPISGPSMTHILATVRSS